MILKRCLVGLTVTICLVQIVFSQNQVQNIYFKDVKCNDSSKYIYNVSCFAKSYSRTISTVNVNIRLYKPLDDILMRLRLFFKYGVIYREAMHSPFFDLCAVLKSESSNRMVAQLIQLIRDSVDPKQVHECPYSSFQVYNVTPKTHSLIPIYPTGDYKVYFDFVKKNDEFLGMMSFVVTITSPNKDTFG